MDLVKSITDILKNGADEFAYKRVGPTGADLGDGADTWHDGVLRVGSTREFTQPVEMVYGESGNLLTTEDGNFAAKIMLTSAQSGAHVEKFIKDEIVGKYFAVFIKVGKGLNQTTEEIFAPLIKFERTLSIVAPGRRPVLTMHVLYNFISVTPATVPSWAAAAANTYAVGVGEVYLPKET
ncbi:MAG: hypothetical protein ABIQ27_12940 [Flavobacterium sp.]|uniref:hypothetical protein n=1 Tax=Flavobacterium sp. TaxID=239 RepID=UPI003267EB43